MKKMIVATMVVVCTATGLFANGGAIDERMAGEEPPTCTITIKGSYDGKPIDIKTTVEADNCARAAGELLKAALAKK